MALAREQDLVSSSAQQGHRAALSSWGQWLSSLRRVHGGLRGRPPCTSFLWPLLCSQLLGAGCVLLCVRVCRHVSIADGSLQLGGPSRSAGPTCPWARWGS